MTACTAIDPASEYPVTGSVQVDPAFGEFTTTLGGRPARVVRAGLVDVGGMLQLCGAVAYPDGRARSWAKDDLVKTLVTFNGRIVVDSLGYFSLAPTVASLSGARANCVSTGVPADAEGEWDWRGGGPSSGRVRVS
ncbi:MAG: hypothetical protein AAF667_09705 [Pseudomonadota bacterium]